MNSNYLDTHDNIVCKIDFQLYKNLYKKVLKKVDDELILDLRQDLYWIRDINSINLNIQEKVKEGIQNV